MNTQEEIVQKSISELIKKRDDQIKEVLISLGIDIDDTDSLKQRCRIAKIGDCCKLFLDDICIVSYSDRFSIKQEGNTITTTIG